MIPTPVCPECAGPWLYSLTFQHEPKTCSLYRADSGRADADYHSRFGNRSATAVEEQYIQTLGFDPATEHTIRFNHLGMHLRSVYIGELPAYRPANERDSELLSLYQPITEGETYVLHEGIAAVRPLDVRVQAADGTRRAAQRL